MSEKVPGLGLPGQSGKKKREQGFSRGLLNAAHITATVNGFSFAAKQSNRIPSALLSATERNWHHSEPLRNAFNIRRERPFPLFPNPPKVLFDLEGGPWHPQVRLGYQ